MSLALFWKAHHSKHFMTSLLPDPGKVKSVILILRNEAIIGCELL